MKVLNQKGITLLEMLIVLGIMSVLVVASNQAIQSGLRAKLKLQDQLDDMSKVRDSLKVIERDVNLAYHYRDLEMEFKKEVQKQLNAQPTQPNTPPSTPPTPPTPPAIPDSAKSWLAEDVGRKDPTTHFVGSNDSMYFITSNAGRIAEDVPQADFIKVGYFLSSCKPVSSQSEGTGKCLMRRTSPLAEGDVTTGGSSTILIDNISEFSLRYIGKGKQDWNNNWNTKGGDASTKDRFPEAIEINMTYSKGKDSKKKKISMQIVAAVHFPNNPPQ